MLDVVRRAELMAYCKIDALEAGESGLLERFYRAAVFRIGIQEPQAGTERRDAYDLCINSLVLDAWDHRGAQTDSVQFSENKELRRLINHLQLTEPVPDSGTGSGTGG